MPEPVVSLIALHCWHNIMPHDRRSCTSLRLRNQERNRGPGLGKAWYLPSTGFTYRNLSPAACLPVGYLSFFLSLSLFFFSFLSPKCEGRSKPGKGWVIQIFLLSICAHVFLISQIPTVKGWAEGLLEICFACWPGAVLRICSESLLALTVWYNKIK